MGVWVGMVVVVVVVVNTWVVEWDGKGGSTIHKESCLVKTKTDTSVREMWGLGYAIPNPLALLPCRTYKNWVVVVSSCLAQQNREKEGEEKSFRETGGQAGLDWYTIKNRLLPCLSQNARVL